MPLFDVQCTQCGLITKDVVLPVHVEDSIRKNPVDFTCRCGAKDKFTKLPPRVAVHFKGSGWSK